MAFRRTPTRTMTPIFTIFCLFFVFSSIASAASAVLGVDLGTEYIKATLVKPGIPLEIVLTKDSRRKELSAVAFKPPKNPQASSFPERAYGSDAVALAARFPGDVYPNLKTLLGLGADNSVVKEWSARRPALKLEAEKTRGTAAFRSNAFVGEEEPWAVEEILAMELQSIQKNAEALAGKGSTVKDVVLTVPPFYTAEEKRAVELAAELAGLRVLELLSDGLAVGLNYATTRTFPSISQVGKAEHHMVFDMGAGSTKATILKFQGRDVGKFNKTVQEVFVVGSGWDRTFGGDALNAIIVDDMIAQFVESKPAQLASVSVEAVQSHGRAAAKLWKEAERIRQVLSANSNTQASFEALYEDVDFRYKITREQFETLVKSHMARVAVTVQNALDVSGLTVNDLESVILHGGASRTPFVQKELEKVIGKADKVRTNVNADEAAVFGAGFRGASLSPSFRVKEIRSSEGATYAAGIKWINIVNKPQHQRLWHPTSYLGAEKQYSFKNQEDFSINFYQHVPSSENVSPGSAEKELMSITTRNLTYSVARLKDKFSCKDSDINVRLSTRLATSNGEVEVVKLVVDCDTEVNEDKGGVVDSVKGMFGFGKKDQVPLSEDEVDILQSSVPEADSTTTSSSITSSTETSESASSTSNEAAQESKEDEKSKKQDTKAKTTKRTEIIPLKYTTILKGLPQLPEAERTRMKNRIVAFDDSDRTRGLREESLNQLEAFTYKVRDILDNEDFIAVSTPKERKDLEAKSQAASEWIYAGGSNAGRDELKKRLKELKDIVDPMETRKEEAASRPEQVKLLYEALNQTKTFIDTIKGQIENDTKAHASFSSSKSSAAAVSTSTSTSTTATEDDFAGLEDDSPDTLSTTSAPAEEETLPPPLYTMEDLTTPQTLYDTISKWASSKLTEQEKLPPTTDPIIVTKDIAAKTKQLQDATIELIMKTLKQPTNPKKIPPKDSSKPKKSSDKSKSKKNKAKAGTKTQDPVEKVRVDIGDDMTEEELMEAIENAQKENKARDPKIKHVEL